jgi:hypothetical protein
MAAEPPKVRKLSSACTAVAALVSVVEIGEKVQTSSTMFVDRCARLRTLSRSIQDRTPWLTDGVFPPVFDASSRRSFVDLPSVPLAGTGFAVAVLEAAFDALSGGLEPAAVTDARTRVSATGDVGVSSALSPLQDDPSGAAVARREALETSGHDETVATSVVSQVHGLISRGIPVGIPFKQGLRAGLSSLGLTVSLAEVGSLVSSHSTRPGQAADPLHGQGINERTHQTRDQYEALGDGARRSDGSPRLGEALPSRGVAAFYEEDEGRRGKDSTDKKG